MVAYISNYTSVRTSEPPQVQVQVQGGGAAAPAGQGDVSVSAPRTGQGDARTFARLRDTADRALKEHPPAHLTREELAYIAPEPPNSQSRAGKVLHKQWEALAKASGQAILAAERAGKSLAALDAFPASRFIRPLNPGEGASPEEKARFEVALAEYDMAFEVLKKVVTDQQALEKALADYEACPGLPRETAGKLELAQRSCAFRSGELLAMAAELSGGARPQSAGVTVADARRAFSLELHGGVSVLGAMQAEAGALYTALAALEARSDLPGSSAPAGDAAAPETPVKEAAADIQRKLTDLQDRLAAVLTPSAKPNDPSARRLVLDDPSFTALSVSLEAAKTRVQVLVDPPETIITNEMLIDELIDPGPFDAFIADADENHKFSEDHLNLLRDASRSLKDLKAGMLDQLNSNGRLDAGILATDPRWLNFKSKINPVLTDLVRNKQMPLVSALRGVLVGIGLFRESLVKANIHGINTVKEHLANPAYRPYQTGEYLAGAASGHVSVESLVECSMRGINPSLVEVRADRGRLVSQRALGAGAVNAVTLCRYETIGGDPVNLVFKPEREARHGLLVGMSAGKLGYSDDARALDLNAAASVSATAIGCGHTLCRTTAGTHEGRFGMFMELAPGRAAGEVFSSKEAEDPNSVVSQLRDHPARYAGVQARLMQEMCKLEWADVLSGQVDRHQGNYLVDIDLQGGNVQVTGIDNDASFSHAMLGLGMIASGAGVVNLSELPREQFEETSSLYGLNQINRPELIDEETFHRLLAIDEDQYAANLSPHLRGDATALDSAMARLRNAKAHAADLHAQGRVVSDWTSHEVDGKSLMQVYADQFNREVRRVGKDNVLRAVSFFGLAGFYLSQKVS